MESRSVANYQEGHRCRFGLGKMAVESTWETLRQSLGERLMQSCIRSMVRHGEGCRCLLAWSAFTPVEDGREGVD